MSEKAMQLCEEFNDGGNEPSKDPDQSLTMNNDDIPPDHQSFEDQQQKRFWEDRYQWLCYFPTEIWVMILNNLQNGDDICSVSNASPFLRCILYPKLAERIFSSVFPVLSQQYRIRDSVVNVNSTKEDTNPSSHSSDCRSESQNSETDSRRCLSCERDRMAREHSGYWNLRSVCHSWKEAVDSFYQCYPDTVVDIEDPNQQICTRPHRQPYQFYNIRGHNVQNNFLRHFRQTHGKAETSPFVSKAITISPYNCTQAEEVTFLAELSQILSKYGHHVRHFKLEETNGKSNMVVSFDRLLEMVKKMPNLEYLQVSLSEDFNLFNENYKQAHYLGQSRRSSLLTKLNIKFEYNRDLRYSKFFQLIRNMCGDTLTELVLEWLPHPIMEMCSSFPIGFLGFKNLRKLQLTTEGFYSLDFLLLMQDSLEFLDVLVVVSWRKKSKRERQARKADQGKTIKFFSCFRKLHESNVWSVLPQLERVRYFELKSFEARPNKIWDISRLDWENKKAERTC